MLYTIYCFVDGTRGHNIFFSILRIAHASRSTHIRHGKDVQPRSDWNRQNISALPREPLHQLLMAAYPVLCGAHNNGDFAVRFKHCWAVHRDPISISRSKLNIHTVHSNMNDQGVWTSISSSTVRHPDRRIIPWDFVGDVMTVTPPRPDHVFNTRSSHTSSNSPLHSSPPSSIPVYTPSWSHLLVIWLLPTVSTLRVVSDVSAH